MNNYKIWSFPGLLSVRVHPKEENLCIVTYGREQTTLKLPRRVTANLIREYRKAVCVKCDKRNRVCCSGWQDAGEPLLDPVCIDCHKSSHVKKATGEVVSQ